MADLTSMAVEEVLARWRPGSHDWSWTEEFYDLLNDPHHREVTAAVRLRVVEEGVGFIDGIAPILLGSDGRVWDGHHRLCIARELGIESVLVDVVQPTPAEEVHEDMLIGYAHAPRILAALRSGGGTDE